MVSWHRGTYQAAHPCLYCARNHQEKEVIQCLIVIPCGVSRTGFSLPAGSAPRRTSSDDNAKGRASKGRGLSLFLALFLALFFGFVLWFCLLAF
jgi:hypothetical protein